MVEPPKSERVVRFGVFEADLAGGELRRRGMKVRLQDRPFQILALLLGRPGEVVTREELRKTLWPADTFVDFDNAINTSVNKLREALGDSAENPRFIDTVGRRGYRWIPDVSFVGAGHAVAGPAPTAAPNGAVRRSTAEGPPSVPLESLQPRRRKEDSAGLATKLAGGGRKAAWLAAGATFLLGALASFWWFSPSPVPRVIRSTQITRDGRQKPHTSFWASVPLPLLTDGSRVYLLEMAPPAYTQVSAPGGETVPVSIALQIPTLFDISPSGSEMLAGSFPSQRYDATLWVVPLPGGSPRRLGGIVAQAAAWFPDGRRIVYATGSDLYVARSDGSDSRKLWTAAGLIWQPRVSPDG